ncbi:MAG: hypothetical protein J2P36_39815 [Ktedonobacteraceae bacterium]|nr:hypothetical protein [Ktedonobacteraceae bacterium]
MWKNSRQDQNTDAWCSFCGNRPDQANQLTAGPGNMYICRDCVDLYRDHLIKEAGNITAEKKPWHVCSSCGTRSPASHRYCFNCGSQFTQET